MNLKREQLRSPVILLLLGLLTLEAGGCLYFFVGRLAHVWEITFWCAGMLGLVGWLYRGREPLVGPLLVYDLVRTSRRGEPIAARCLYAGALSITLLLAYWNWFPDLSWDGLFRGVRIAHNASSQFAGSFFGHFLVVQFAFIFLFTPLFTATVISEEKERRTLEFLLVTPLSDREIILGILFGRLANLGLLLLTGLPFFGLLQFMGGVDPNLVFAGFVAAAFVMAGLGAMSILVSVHAPTTLAAVVGSYLWTALLFVVFCVLGFPLIDVQSGAAWEKVESSLWLSLGTLSLTFGLIAVACAGSAISQLRVRALGSLNQISRSRESSVPRVARVAVHSRPKRSQSPRVDGWGPYDSSDLSFSIWPNSQNKEFSRPQPLLAHNPLLWKEMYVVDRWTPPDSTGALIIVSVIAGLGAAVLLLSHLAAWFGKAQIGPDVNSFIRSLIPVLGAPLLLTAISASKRISRERERRTLDNLLSIPPERSAVLFSKWLACVLVARWVWLCVGVMMLFGVVGGGISILAVPLLLAAVLIHTTFMASLGLWFSALNRATLRATLLTFLCALMVFLGPGFFSASSRSGSYSTSNPDIRKSDWPALRDFFLYFGLSPRGTYQALTFRTDDLIASRGELPVESLWAAVAGLHVYMGLTVVLWFLALARLRAEKGPAVKRKLSAIGSGG